METRERAALVEALLFASDEPLGIGTFQKVLEDLSPAGIREILEELKAEYDATSRGFTLLEVAGGFVLCTKEAWAPWVEKLMKGRRRIRLSRAALETVAVIAYKQPIAGSEIERIRGVDASSVLATLLERDLIMIKGRGSGPGKPLLYGTTQEFLNYFGLNKLSDLPRLDEVSALAARGTGWSDAERARFEKAGVEPDVPEPPAGEAGEGEEAAAAEPATAAPAGEPAGVAEEGEPPGLDAIPGQDGTPPDGV